MDTGRRLRDVLLGARLRRLRAACPTSTRCARCPGRRAPRCAWPTSRGTTARDVVASPRQILRRQLDAAGRARLDGATPAPSSSSSSSATPTRRRGTRATATSSRPTSTTSTTRCSGTARVEPLIRRIRNAMAGAGHGGRELQGRVQLRPARDQLPLRRRAARPPTSTRSTRTAPRRSPPRRAWRSPSWPSSTSARATRATSTSRSRDERRRDAVRATTEQLFERFLAGQLACLRELTLLLAPQRQLLQALRGAARSRRPRSPGATTTAPARCASSATAPALRFENRAAGRRPQPVPGAERR